MSTEVCGLSKNNEGMDAVAAIAEVVTWVAVVVAVLAALVALILRLVRGPWLAATAVRLDDELSWTDADGALHSAEADEEFPGCETVLIHYRARRPHICYPSRVAPDEAALRFVVVVLVIVTAVATLGNIAATVVSVA